MSNKETGGYAFPMPLGNEDISPDVAGMTLRDYFAIKSIDIASRDSDGELLGAYIETVDGIAIRAYLMADAMLKARK